MKYTCIFNKDMLALFTCTCSSGSIPHSSNLSLNAMYKHSMLRTIGIAGKIWGHRKKVNAVAGDAVDDYTSDVELYGILEVVFDVMGRTDEAASKQKLCQCDSRK
eukprot:5252847-Pleurochrysis_carterae.AAC.1